MAWLTLVLVGLGLSAGRLEPWLRLNQGAKCVVTATVAAVEKPARCLELLKRTLNNPPTASASAHLATALLFETGSYVQLVLLLEAYPEPFADPLLAPRILVARQMINPAEIALTNWWTLTNSQQLFDLAASLRSKHRQAAADASIDLAYALDVGWRSELDRSFAAFWVGRQFQTSQKWEAAIKAYRAALLGFLEEPQPIGREYAAYSYRRLGEIAEQQGYNEAAVEYYAQSSLTSPQHADFFRMADLMLRQGHGLQEVYAVLADLRRRGPPDDPYLWANSAAVFREWNAPELAQQVLDEVPPRLKETPPIRGKLAQLAADRGDLQTARRIYQSLLEEARSQGDPLAIAVWANALADVLVCQGNNVGAITLLEEATQRAPSVPWYWFNLGQAYRKQDMSDEARVAFQKALELEPGYLEAAQALSEMDK